MISSPFTILLCNVEQLSLLHFVALAVEILLAPTPSSDVS